MRAPPRRYVARKGPPIGLERHVIGRRVRTMRRKGQLTTREVAARCGLDHTAIRRIENGDFNWNHIPLVSRALGIDRRDLVRGTCAWVGYRWPFDTT